MVQPQRPPNPPSPTLRRFGLVAVGFLLFVAVMIGSNYERLGAGSETSSTTIPALSAPIRPLHNPNPAVTSPANR